MHNFPVIVLDFETTGLSPRYGDRAIEIGAVRIENNRVVDRFQSLMNPGFRISSFIESYTGISNRMVDAAPSCGEVMAQFAEFICDYPLVENDSLMVVCEKESENYQTQLTLKYDLPAEIQFNSASININPVLEVTSEVLLSEITWLTELPFYRFELPTPTSTTPTETLEITETLPVKEINELTTWLSENLPLLTNENSLEYAFHDVLYSISIQGEVLVLNIARVDTQ